MISGDGSRTRRRVVTAAIGVGVAAGVAVGATALAAAASSPTTTTPGSSSTSTTTPGSGHTFHGGFRGGPGRFGGFGGAAGLLGLGGGGVAHGQFTVKGPNGYETLDVRTGTVSAVSNTSGSTWSLTIKSADGTSGTFTVDSSTSVNGGESGIASVKSGDTVWVTATESGGTATATMVMDQTTLQANGKSWMPAGPPMSGTGPGGAPGASSPASTSGETTT